MTPGRQEEKKTVLLADINMVDNFSFKLVVILEQQ